MTDDETKKAPVLIWSSEHGAWWRPNERGYSTSVFDAGLYDRTRAEAIVRATSGKNERIKEIPSPCAFVDGTLGQANFVSRESHDAVVAERDAAQRKLAAVATSEWDRIHAERDELRALAKQAVAYVEALANGRPPKPMPDDFWAACLKLGVL